MPFVKRDENQTIIAVFHQAFPGADEEVTMDNPDIIDFFHGCDSMLGAHLLQSDLQFIRVIEDLFDVLLQKGVVSITDFNPAVVKKLTARHGIRNRMSGLGGFIATDEDNPKI